MEVNMRLVPLAWVWVAWAHQASLPLSEDGRLCNLSPSRQWALQTPTREPAKRH